MLRVVTVPQTAAGYWARGFNSEGFPSSSCPRLLMSLTTSYDCQWRARPAPRGSIPPAAGPAGVTPGARAGFKLEQVWLRGLAAGSLPAEQHWQVPSSGLGGRPPAYGFF